MDAGSLSHIVKQKLDALESEENTVFKQLRKSQMQVELMQTVGSYYFKKAEFRRFSSLLDSIYGITTTVCIDSDD